MAPSTLSTYFYLMFSFMTPGRLSLEPSTLIIYLYLRLSFVTLGRALIMEPSTLDLYGFGSVRSLVPF